MAFISLSATFTLTYRLLSCGPVVWRDGWIMYLWRSEVDGGRYHTAGTRTEHALRAAAPALRTAFAAACCCARAFSAGRYLLDASSWRLRGSGTSDCCPRNLRTVPPIAPVPAPGYSRCLQGTELDLTSIIRRLGRGRDVAFPAASGRSLGSWSMDTSTGSCVGSAVMSQRRAGVPIDLCPRGRSA